jgi:ribonucleoside-diphosphate reductase alpha chain
MLRAYAAHDAATGYVQVRQEQSRAKRPPDAPAQGMNFQAAFLLMAGLAEELRKRVNRPVADLPIADEADTSITVRSTTTTSEGRPSAAAAGHLVAKALTASIQNQKDAPPCPKCGHISVRNGACYKCLNCGESLGCS